MTTKHTLLSLLALFVSSTTVLAQPSVEGNTISWPDNGWYQVQAADGMTSVCNGGRSCDVEPGIYIVINHSTGERFERTQVGEPEGGSPVTVTGNVISWPDDGWYQVQDEVTFAEVCGGTQSCAVSPGTYSVINHTTGERFSGIDVISTEPPETLVTVAGNVISWPDDGWYQVQNAVTFEEVCSGTRSCSVEPGIYIVINHTLTLRYEDVVVPDQTDNAVTANKVWEEQSTTATLYLPTFLQVESTATSPPEPVAVIQRDIAPQEQLMLLEKMIFKPLSESPDLCDVVADYDLFYLVIENADRTIKIFSQEPACAIGSGPGFFQNQVDGYISDDQLCEFGHLLGVMGFVCGDGG